MNKNVIGIILFILAGALVYFYGWPKIQPYLNLGGTPQEVTTGPMGMT